MSSPLLALRNFSLDLVVDTDASVDGLGAALLSNGEEWVLGYASRGLSRSERSATMEWVLGYASRALSRSERSATMEWVLGYASRALSRSERSATMEWVLGYASRALSRSERSATMEWVLGYVSRALSRSERSATMEWVLGYVSSALSRSERSERREMLALVCAACHFRRNLYGKKFTLRTDNHSLQWLHKFKAPDGQVARWLEVLSEFDYTVMHRAGKQHSNADANCDA